MAAEDEGPTTSQVIDIFLAEAKAMGDRVPTDAELRKARVFLRQLEAQTREDHLRSVDELLSQVSGARPLSSAIIGCVCGLYQMGLTVCSGRRCRRRCTQRRSSCRRRKTSCCCAPVVRRTKSQRGTCCSRCGRCEFVVLSAHTGATQPWDRLGARQRSRQGRAHAPSRCCCLQPRRNCRVFARQGSSSVDARRKPPPLPCKRTLHC